jgi:hypothetical protein
MSKHKFFTGQPIFTQLLSYIPRPLISEVARANNSDRYSKRFKTYDHLVAMLYVGFYHCSSLREAITGLQANASRLLHMGLTHHPRRSTLSDANKRRDAKVFEQLYHKLYTHYYGSLPDSRPPKDHSKQLYIIDSTTISLFSNIIRGAGSYRANGRKKGGVKAHMLVNAEHNIASFVRITEGRQHDLVFLQNLQVPSGSVVVFDKAYANYIKFAQWTREEVTWVTRLKTDAVYQVDAQIPIDCTSAEQGLLEDRLITLGRPSNRSKTPLIKARLIVYYDKIKKRTFRFITNDMHSRPEQIAAIYKRRWQIELIFKRIKQRYPLRYFLGDNENSIKIQIWTALICDLLIQIVKDQVERYRKTRWSYANLAAMIKHHLMTYIRMIDFLLNPEQALLNYKPPNPHNLTLF